MYMHIMCMYVYSVRMVGGKLKSNLGVCFHCPKKRPWSLDQDSRTEKWMTLWDINILCGMKKGNYCRKLCESTLDLWVDGVAIHNE